MSTRSLVAVAGVAVGAGIIGALAGILYARRRRAESPMSELPTLGYHKIRGLAAPARMMLMFARQAYVNKAYAEDLKGTWFGGDKPVLAKRNSCINLPYIIDGDRVITQSNSVLLYLGKKLGIDQDSLSTRNHQALDQIMDLRNDLMGIVYPFHGKCKSKEELPAAFARYLSKVAQTHFDKLENFCLGPFICGAEPQSADFHLFEMLDQHMIMAMELAMEFDFGQFPMLCELHATMKADERLADYFEHDMYRHWSFNNPLFSNFNGASYGLGPYGPTVDAVIRPPN